MNIEEKAREYAQCNGVMPRAQFAEHKAFWIKTFIKGADWMEKEKNAEIAQLKDQLRWRKVEEEMPEIGIKVIVKTINGNYSISEIYIPKDCHNTVLGDKEWKGSHTFKTSITEWMPIPQID